MLNPKKEATPLKEVEINIERCPICTSFIFMLHFMQDTVTKKQSKWYHCSCGVIWQKDEAVIKLRNLDKDDKKLLTFCEYPVRIYAPLIEELMDGRRVLFSGDISEMQSGTFKTRGWIPALTHTFETEDFGTKKYDLIWFYHSFESFLDPLAALKKAKSLLTEDGILFLASPDTDFIHTRGPSGFRYWKPDRINLMWNRHSITKQLEQLNFNVIMSRQNDDMRFPETDDFHLIAQLKYF